MKKILTVYAVGIFSDTLAQAIRIFWLTLQYTIKEDCFTALLADGIQFQHSENARSKK